MLLYQKLINTFIASLCLILLIFPQSTYAQITSPGISVGASAINTDFQNSTITLDQNAKGQYIITFHILNKGNIPSKNAKVSMIIPDRWSYVKSEGDFELAQTSNDTYGLVGEWELAPIAINQTADIRVTLQLSDKWGEPALFVSVSSEYSVPVYAHINNIDSGTRLQTLWESPILRGAKYFFFFLRESVDRLFSKLLTK